MSFYTRNFTTFFPQEYKIHRDESSKGFRFYNFFSNFLENVYYESHRLANSFKIPNENKETDFIYKIKLEPKDFMSYQESYVTAPRIFATRSAQKIELTNCITYEEFIHAVPDFFTLENEEEVINWKIWDSTAPASFATMNNDEYLFIDLSQVDRFLTRFFDKDVTFKNVYRINLVGYDSQYNDIYESVFVSDKMIYKTTNMYRELVSVEFDGFVGDWTIYYSSKKTSFKERNFTTKATVYNGKRKQLKLDLHTENGKSYFRYYARLRHFAPGYTNTNDQSKEFLVDQLIQDEGGTPYLCLDYCVDPRNNDLLTLDNNNTLRYHRFDNVPFTELRETVSEAPFLIFATGIQRVGYDEELSFGCIYKNVVAHIYTYQIYRYKPDGTKEYLQQLHKDNWTVSVKTFYGLDGINLRQRIGTLRMKSHFDQVGQWEFYLKVKYEEFNEEEIVGCAIMCEYNNAYKTYVLNTSEVLDGVFYNKENKLCASYGNKFVRLEEFFNLFVANSFTEEIAFRDLFDEDEIEIIIPMEFIVKTISNLPCFEINNIKKPTIHILTDERYIIDQSHLSNKGYPVLLSYHSDYNTAILNPIQDNIYYYIDNISVSLVQYQQAVTNGTYTSAEVFFEVENFEKIHYHSSTSTTKGLGSTIVPSAEYNNIRYEGTY